MKTKEDKIILNIVACFTQYTSTLCRCIPHLKTLVLIEAEKSVTKHFTGEKENKM